MTTFRITLQYSLSKVFFCGVATLKLELFCEFVCWQAWMGTCQLNTIAVYVFYLQFYLLVPSWIQLERSPEDLSDLQNILMAERNRGNIAKI